MGKWILCKDHLPEVGEGPKWVTVKGHDVINCRPGETISEAVKRVSNIRGVTQAFYDHEEEMWLDPSFAVPLMLQPIAWMDIEYPEPYEGDYDMAKINLSSVYGKCCYDTNTSLTNN